MTQDGLLLYDDPFERYIKEPTITWSDVKIGINRSKDPRQVAHNGEANFTQVRLSPGQARESIADSLGASRVALQGLGRIGLVLVLDRMA